jgi:cytochrome P450
MSKTAFRKPPSPPKHPLFGHVPDIKDPTTRLDCYMKAFETHGDVAELIVMSSWYCFFAPDAAQHILQEHHRNYVKGPVWAKLKPFLGESLLTAEGAHWVQERRLLQPSFHMARLVGLADTMVDAVHVMLDRWRTGVAPDGHLDVYAEMTRLTLEIVCATLFGVKIGGRTDELSRALTVALTHTNARVFAVVSPPLWLPTPGNRSFASAVATLDRVVYGLIAERQRTGEDTGDMLSLLMACRDEETGLGLEPKQLRDEVAAMVVAGHETTASTLSWTCYRLSQHPEVLARLRAEVLAVLGDRRATFADYPRLDYTGRVIDEVLRLHPPVWTLARQAIATDEIDGYPIQPGQDVCVIPYVVHRHPRYWPNAELFDPDRFLPEVVATRPKFAYLPFGGGGRLCIGQHFAKLELVLATATLVQACDLEMATNGPVLYEAMMTLRPHGSVPMHAKFHPPQGQAVIS